MADLGDHLIGGRAAAAAAHVGDDAERTAIIAAVLNFEIGAGALAGGVFDGGGKKIVLGENIADLDLAVIRLGNKIGDARFMGISNDEGDSFESGEFFGRALGITPGDENAGIGAFAMDAADHLADFIVGGGSYGAGVEDDEVGVVGVGGGG